MAEVLVLADHTDGVVRRVTHELLTLAARLGEPVVVAAGSGAEQVRDDVAGFGAAKVLTAPWAQTADELIVPYVDALAAAVDATAPAAVLIASSAAGKEIAGRLAVLLESGLITDAVDVVAIDSQDGLIVQATQSVFAGSFTVESQVTHGVPIIAVKPNSCDPVAAAGAGVIVPLAAPTQSAGVGAQVVERKPKARSGRPELSEAAIVVSGGRGTAGDFGPVAAFADVLGAAVGASRAAVDAGWYPHASQVGQTGKQVSPQLYVACGISGAIQHRAGMQTSKTIIAINTDADAPIFELADLGIVGDLFEVLPAATRIIQERAGQPEQ